MFETIIEELVLAGVHTYQPITAQDLAAKVSRILTPTIASQVLDLTERVLAKLVSQGRLVAKGDGEARTYEEANQT